MSVSTTVKKSTITCKYCKEPINEPHKNAGWYGENGTRACAFNPMMLREHVPGASDE